MEASRWALCAGGPCVRSVLTRLRLMAVYVRNAMPGWNPPSSCACCRLSGVFPANGRDGRWWWSTAGYERVGGEVRESPIGMLEAAWYQKLCHCPRRRTSPGGAAHVMLLNQHSLALPHGGITTMLSASRPRRLRRCSSRANASTGGGGRKAIQVGDQTIRFARDSTRWLGIWLDSALMIILREHQPSETG